MTFEQKKTSQTCHKCDILARNVTFFQTFFLFWKSNFKLDFLYFLISLQNVLIPKNRKHNLEKNLTTNQGFLKMPKNFTFWTKNSNLQLYCSFKRWHLNIKNVTNMSSKCDIFVKTPFFLWFLFWKSTFKWDYIYFLFFCKKIQIQKSDISLPK